MERLEGPETVEGGGGGGGGQGGREVFQGLKLIMYQIIWTDQSGRGKTGAQRGGGCGEGAL